MKGGLDLKKSTLLAIAWLYVLLLIITFSIYVYNTADENWTINTMEERGNIATFAGAFLIGTVLFSISATAQSEEGDTVKKSTAYSGLAIAAFFIVWRLSVSFF